MFSIVRPSFSALVILTMLTAFSRCQSSAPADPASSPAADSVENSSEMESAPENRSVEPSDDRGVEVVERTGIYVYHYPETLQLEDPYKNYLSKRRVFDDNLAAEIESLLAEEADYTPEYRARCLPVYDYGIVIVEEKERRTYLFSFRCNTMHYKEKKLWKDFTPIRTRLYALLQYQVNDNTSVIVDSRDN